MQLRWEQRCFTSSLLCIKMLIKHNFREKQNIAGHQLVLYRGQEDDRDQAKTFMKYQLFCNFCNAFIPKKSTLYGLIY